MKIAIMFFSIFFLSFTTNVANAIESSKKDNSNEQIFNAYLYIPPTKSFKMLYPYDKAPKEGNLTSVLVIEGKDFQIKNGDYKLKYRILNKELKSLSENIININLQNGWFEKGIEISEHYSNAECIEWEIDSSNSIKLSGKYKFNWIKFSGVVKYKDGNWRSTYIALMPNTFSKNTHFFIPVNQNGTFEAMVPRKIYGVVNVNGAGYKFDAMERWAWNYNLLYDRTDSFLLDRTELYGMNAFNINGGGNVIFVTFRPTSLSKVLKFDSNKDGIIKENEDSMITNSLKSNPESIAPSLLKENIKLWFNEIPQQILQLDKIIEANKDGVRQIQYIIQFTPEKINRGVWHEIKIEVESTETHNNKILTDFGQGSVGFYLN